MHEYSLSNMGLWYSENKDHTVQYVWPLLRCIGHVNIAKVLELCVYSWTQGSKTLFIC